MFRPLLRSHRRPPRRGTAVLITCFFLITIMMVMGLALIMYAARERAVALAYMDASSAGSTTLQPPAPENTVNHFFSTLIYDVPDDGDQLFNALRGHSIARAMYGSRTDFPNAGTPWAGSTVPWAGVGTFHENAGGYTYNGTTAYPSLATLDRAQIVNHTPLRMDNQFLLVDPEWTGNRIAAGGVLPLFKDSRNGNYVGKHAGYTYPDLKNFFLAARDPATGKVMVPSFHRDWLFGTLAQTNPNWNNDAGRALTLRPRPAEHPNFPRVPLNADGTLTGDVQNLPGGYHYDPAQGFVSYNDSLWMHIGLPPITLSDGRLVQPMVAPLILPLDGKFDLSEHGNRLRAGGAHHSHGGYGRWEVNLAPGMTTGSLNETERQKMMDQRVTSGRTAAFDQYNPGKLLPLYSPVAWTGADVNFKLPSQLTTAPDNLPLLGLPSFGAQAFSGGPYGNFQNDNAAVNHPAAYNSNEFALATEASPSGPVFPYSDLKRFGLRYAFSPSWYSAAFPTRRAGATFQTETDPMAPVTYEYKYSPSATWVPAAPNRAYRLDPAHARRDLFAPRYGYLERPALTPNFVGVDGTTALQITAGATKPSALTAAASPYPAPTTRGSISDFLANNRWTGVQAALGSVNLNRPLADYRTDATKPLYPDPAQPVTLPGNSNMDPVSVGTADRDRREFAKDIFARLIIATGAAGEVQFNTATNRLEIRLPTPPTASPPLQLTPLAGGAPITYTQQQYDALRYLAQLAVNIVDYIDNDDISTIFAWNPSNFNDPPSGLATDLSPNEVGNRVVFGVEKPRLVLNEVYSEITNDPADKEVDGVTPLPMTAKAHVRFWAELLNPTHVPHATPAQGVLGDGSVPLAAYQIQISRANRSFGPTGPLPAAQQGNTSGALTDPTNPEYAKNTMGVFDPAKGAPDATCQFSLLASLPASVKPNDGQYGNTTNPVNGFVLLRTDITGTNSPKQDEFDPTTTSNSMWGNAIVCPKPDSPNALGYTIQMPVKADLSKKEFKQHVVLLQRLANPYLPHSATSNPYVTVDMMDYVPAFDAVIRASGDATKRDPRPATNPANDGSQYDPVKEATGALNRFSVGKVQPLAGFSYATTSDTAGTYNQYLFNGATAPALNSMVMNQTATGATGEPLHTFGRHNGNSATVPAATLNAPQGSEATLNGSETIMLPFDWQIHMDRPLETLGDVFFARDTKPYQLTQEFVTNSTAGPNAGLKYEAGYARWKQHNDGLARALELLTVKSPDLFTAHGGRSAGKVNVNAVFDRRIIQGVWDPQASNRFDMNFVNDMVWEQWLNSRSPLQDHYGPDGNPVPKDPTRPFLPHKVPVPNQRFDTATNTFVSACSVLDMPTTPNGGDRPFLPYGAPAAAAGPGALAYSAPNSTGDGDTILRRPAGAGTLPYLYQTMETHAYTQSEPLRKVMNNVTTVSHTFVVYLTIGYFTVESPTTPPNWPSNVAVPPQFGAEAYDKVPGDLRQKFVGVVDMSNMALKAAPPANDPDPHALEKPFFTALTSTVRQADPATLSFSCYSYDAANGRVSVAADGELVWITAGSPLVIGYGAETQVVTVASVIGRDNTTGIGQVTVNGLTRTAWGGTCVSNVRPGYAGPRTGFDLFSPSTSVKYKPVVPYIERLR